jgi:hypothetical protein
MSCTILPLPDHQAQFLVGGRERLRWHFGPQYARPFFYPLVGPASGLSMTRMGHPGAPDHDHHLSIWFAHFAVQGVDFWRSEAKGKIRQTQWLAYQDGEDEAVMAVKLAWNDGHDPKDLMTQDFFAAARPGPDGETFLELQTTLTPAAASIELQKTNFGLLAVRMAKALSAAYGSGGLLTNSEGATGEPAIFGKAAKWVDYSGTQPGGHREGLTYFDHPSNPGHPSHWHVRTDGWMGSSLNFAGPIAIAKAKPLTVRYLLHAHRGPADAVRAAATFADFAKRPPMALVKAPAPHVQWGVVRKA